MEIAGWEELYQAGSRGREEHPTILLEETAAKLNPGKAIDLACGSGRNAIYLAQRGWNVTAVDGSESAIEILKQRAIECSVTIKAEVADLATYEIPPAEFDLIVIAFYLQRDLIEQAKSAVKPDGTVLVIAHIPDPGEPWTPKRAALGELRNLFSGWQILHDYEGPSRDPAHRRPVAEIVAKRVIVQFSHRL